MEKNKFIEIKIDELNRITIPKDLREELGCEANGDVFIKQIGNEMILSFGKRCMFCGDAKDKLVEFKSKTICMTCINAINNDELLETVTNSEFYRKVDYLFRVVLPKEICKNLEINNLINVYIDNGMLFIKPSSPFSCAVCGDSVSLMPIADIHICKDCMNGLSNMACLQGE